MKIGIQGELGAYSHIAVENIYKNEQWSYYEKNTLTLENYSKNLKEYKFVLCPQGNGIDTHRIWEALYSGAIPVIQKHISHKNLEGLPILFLDDLRNISSEKLTTYLEKINYEDLDFNKLTCSYWLNIMKSKLDEDDSIENIIKVNPEKLRGVKQTGEKIDLDQFKTSESSTEKKKRKRIIKKKIDPSRFKKSKRNIKEVIEISPEEAAELEPGISFGNPTSVSYTDSDGHVDPEKVVYGCLSSVRQNGGLVHTNESVKSFIKSGDSISHVVTTKDTYECDSVVIAAGSKTPKIAEMLGSKFQNTQKHRCNK